MIVARLIEDRNDKLVPGSCSVVNYEGWIPIDSFDFGYDDPDKESDSSTTAGTPGAGKSTSPPQATVPAKKSTSKGSDKGSKVGIQKKVDTGSCELMFLAMRDRAKTKGIESKMKADIHILATVKHSSGNRYTYPSVMVHLEGVLVREWRIQASGDDRPSETLNLNYDRAAMVYCHFDGKHFLPQSAHGFDQTSNKEWNWPDGEWRKFLPKPGS